MAKFDIKTAQVITDKSQGFDISSAKPIGGEITEPIPTKGFSLFDAPGAATRAGIRALAPGGETPIQAFQRGGVSPETEPRFQEQFGQMAREKAITEASKREGMFSPTTPVGATRAGIESALAGQAGELTGLATDIATNPADLLISLVGGLATKTVPGQAVGRFLTKQRGIPGRGQFRKIKGLPTQAKSGRLAKQRIETLTNENVNLDNILKNKKTTVSARGNALKQKLDNDVKILTASLEDDITRESSKASLKTQGELKRVFKENSKSYAKQLDDIELGLTPEQRGAINSKGIRETFNKTLREAQEALVDDGPGMNGIRKLVKKYSIEDVPSSLFDASGKPIITQTPEKVVPLQEVLNDIKRLKKSFSAGVKTGTTRFGVDDIPIEIARKNIGVYLVDDVGVEGLRSLNKSYVPVMDTTKKANAIFKPFKGPQERGKGTRFIKEQVSRKPGLLPSKEETFQKIKVGEKGFAKGVGDVDKVTREIQQAGQRRINELVDRGLKVTQAQKNILNSETTKITKAIKQNQVTMSDLREVVKGGAKADKTLKVLGITGIITILGITGAKQFLANIIRSVLGVE